MKISNTLSSKHLSILLFIFLAVVIFFISDHSQYKGDGHLIDRWPSFANRYQIFFDRFPATKKMAVHKYSFSGTPSDYFSLYLSLSLECGSHYCSSLSDSDRRNLTRKIVDDTGIKIGVDIFENGINIISTERKLLESEDNLGGRWYNYNSSYYPFAVRYERIELGLLGDKNKLIISNESTYEVHVSIEANRYISRRIYVQPIMEGGSAWPL